MTTWSCRRFGWLFVLTLCGCGADGPGFAFLQSTDTAAPATSRDAMKTAPMLQGAVTLTPPKGYCIDRRSLKRNFALLGQCGRLAGSDTAAAGSVITVSLMRHVVMGDLDETLVAFAPEASVVELDRGEDLVLALMDGPTPEGTAAQHWRGLAQIGSVLMGMAVYGADDQAELTAARAGLLRDLVTGTRAASEIAETAGDRSIPTPPRGLGAVLSELFE